MAINLADANTCHARIISNNKSCLAAAVRHETAIKNRDFFTVQKTLRFITCALSGFYERSFGREFYSAEYRKKTSIAEKKIFCTTH